MQALDGKHVLLCVGGGIAAYKAAELVRRFRAAGADVQVAMTRSAASFISPLTLQALSGRRVATEILDTNEDAEIGHIAIAEQADLVLVAPATANLIARLASGAADDMVTAALLVARCPVVIAPAMNTFMFEHPAVRANLATLASFGYRVVEPDSGVLACGYEGKGRLPDPEVLLEEAAAALAQPDLNGVRVLVSAGPTREPIDAVRYLSNRSSGRMGYSVAAAARRRGAMVTLVSGPVALGSPVGCDVVAVETAEQMCEAVLSRLTNFDVVVMVAAVADYRPARVPPHKIKKGGDSLNLELEPTVDILAEISKARGDRVVVGFAAETERVREYALGKLKRKGLDLIVANDVSKSRTGFDAADNAALIIDRDGGEEDTGVVSKDVLADRILDHVVRLLPAASARPVNSN